MDQPVIKKVLPPDQQAVLQILAKEKAQLEEWGFYLAGGTALALQLGHRQSIDFDFFSEKAGLSDAVFARLADTEDFVLREKDADTLHAELQGVKLSFISAYKYPLITKLRAIADIPVADISDIAAMKLLAITSRATARDYIDLAAIIQSGRPLSRLLETAQHKYGSAFDIMVPLRALAAYDNQDMDNEIPVMLDTELEKKWQDIIDIAVKSMR